MNRSSNTPIYLMSPPRRDWALRGRANFKSRAAGGADAQRARREWTQLADAIVDVGGEAVVMPPGDAELTGMIYTAEAGEFFRTDDGKRAFVLPNMAAEHRRGEAEHIAAFVQQHLGARPQRISASWEAQGDAIRCGGPDAIVHTYGVGESARTERAAYKQVADLLGERHVQIGFRADPWFHGNTFLQFFRNRHRAVMLVCPEALLEGEYRRLREFVEKLSVDVSVVELTRAQTEGYDTNALQVGTTVLAPTTLSETTREVCEQLGLTVRLLTLDELFSKGGGAPVCLTNRLWGLRVDEIPDSVRWSVRPDLAQHTE